MRPGKFWYHCTVYFDVADHCNEPCLCLMKRTHFGVGAVYLYIRVAGNNILLNSISVVSKVCLRKESLIFMAFHLYCID